MPKEPGGDPLVIRNVEFIGGMAEKHGWRPDSPLPEVAFAGRSNVGKSSLLNTLVRRKSFARVSRTPGRTREINFFRINNGFVLVTCPAMATHASPRRRVRVAPHDRELPEADDQLRGIVLLLDIRREPRRRCGLCWTFRAEVEVRRLWRDEDEKLSKPRTSERG